MGELEVRKEVMGKIDKFNLVEVENFINSVSEGMAKNNIRGSILIGLALVKGRELNKDNKSFGDWRSRNFRELDLSLDSFRNLMILGTFFRNRSIEKIGLSVGYILANPNISEYAIKALDKANSVFDKTGKKITIKETNEILKEFKYNSKEATKKRIEEAIRLEEIDALKPESVELFNYVQSLFEKKKLSEIDRLNLVGMTDEERIWSHGYDECRADIDKYFNEAKIYYKEKINVEEEEEEEFDDYWKPKSSIDWEKIVKALSGGEENAGTILLKLMAKHKPLEKKVFKLMKHYLHPDRATGGEEDYKQIKLLEEYENEQ